MLAIRIVVWVIVLGVAPLALAADSAAEIAAAREKYRSSDLDGALKQLEPLLEAKNLDEKLKQRAGALAAQVLDARGSERFCKGQIADAIADFDRQVLLQPGQAPEHWKRGIALYYAGGYEKGK